MIARLSAVDTPEVGSSRRMTRGSSAKADATSSSFFSPCDRVAEIVFSRPGVGKLVFDGVLARNFPLVSGTVLVTTVFFVLCTLAADLMAAWLDPRVRGGL